MKDENRNMRSRRPDVPPADERPDEVLEAKWRIMKDSFRREHSALTDQDMTYKQGEFGMMLGRIGEKIGVTERNLRDTIFNWDDSRNY